MELNVGPADIVRHLLTASSLELEMVGQRAVYVAANLAKGTYTSYIILKRKTPSRQKARTPAFTRDCFERPEETAGKDIDNSGSPVRVEQKGENFLNFIVKQHAVCLDYTMDFFCGYHHIIKTDAVV